MSKLLADIEASIDLCFFKRVLIYCCLGAAVLIPFLWLGAAFQTAASGRAEADYSRDRGDSGSSSGGAFVSADVFSGSPLFGVRTVASSLAAVRSSISELSKDYRLQGVMLSGEPEAIVQDTKSNRTVFVRAGDSLGDLKVKSIQEGRMILEYLGEEKGLTIDG